MIYAPKDEERSVEHRAEREVHSVDAAGAGFAAAMAYLATLRVPVATPGLERMRRLVVGLGHPELAVPAIHVTGTNGKGTVSRLVESALRASKYRTGMYTSPHLEHIRERIVIDGDLIDALTFTTLVDRVRGAIATADGDPPTHFEALTAIGFLAFAEASVDVAVLEAGIGGRNDATNVAQGSVSVLTNVELDHVEVLGRSRQAIAAEKSGIIKPASIAVIGEIDPASAAVVDQRCKEIEASAWRLGWEVRIERDYVTPTGRQIDVATPLGVLHGVEVPFHGRHQASNAALAIAGAQAFLGEALDRDTLNQAWRSVSNPGRFETIGEAPTIVIDVAHNPHGVRSLMDTLEEKFPNRQRVLVVGINPHKSAEEMLCLLRPGARAVVTTEVPDAPAVPARVLAKIASDLGFTEVRAEPEPERAVQVAYEIAKPDDIVVLTGSHYWIGRVRHAIVDADHPRFS